MVTENYNQNGISIVLIGLFFMIHILINYKIEKCFREEFLVRYELKSESRNMNNLLSILVPKFVKVLMNQGLI